MLTRAAL